MMDIARRYAQRIAASYGRIEDVFRHRDHGGVPFQVADVNYWLSGEIPSLIPDDYFADSQAMLRYLVGNIERHLETYENDYIPFLFPGYGTGVIPSAIGAEILFQPKMDPAVQGTVLTSPDQVRAECVHISRQIEQDGTVTRVLRPYAPSL